MNCKGCGAKLQTSNSNKIGFIPKIPENNGNIICKRCFQIKNYGTLESYSIKEKNHFITIKEVIDNESGLLVCLLDIFNFEISLRLNIDKISKFKKIYFILNKKDVLPSSLNERKIKTWASKKVKRLYPNKMIDFDFISSKDLKQVSFVREKIEKYRLGDNVFVIGSANVGKSTFINSLLKIEKNNENIVTTSVFPGTTIEKIKIPLKNNKNIIDTPGIIYKNSFWSKISDQNMKKILPQKEIKQKVYQLDVNQSVFIGGLAIFNFLKGSKKGFYFYFSNELSLLRTKYEKKEKSFNNAIIKKQIFPIEQSLSSYDKFITKKVVLKEDNKIDIVIAGLGWISFKGEKNDAISIDLPADVDIFIRGGMI